MVFHYKHINLEWFGFLFIAFTFNALGLLLGFQIISSHLKFEWGMRRRAQPTKQPTEFKSFWMHCLIGVYGCFCFLFACLMYQFDTFCFSVSFSFILRAFHNSTSLPLQFRLTHISLLFIGERVQMWVCVCAHRKSAEMTAKSKYFR